MVKSNSHVPHVGDFFINGDVACAEGALAAGCRFFGGYPITPATEIAEHMAYRLPEVGGTYIQMEDEIASMAAILGASWGGAKSMTATSGPGFSLMMENLGLALMTETPCVVVNVQRCGPSTGLPTMVGQADMMQARWGSHGDYEIIALSPNSPQEMFDLTVEAFNLAERFRTPVLVMADEVVGHMTERVVIPPPETLSVVARPRPVAGATRYPYTLEPEAVAPMPALGEGACVHVTGLTHNDRGYPAGDVETQRKLVLHLVQKIRSQRAELTRVERLNLEDAEIAVVAYGITSRVARHAVALAREKGIKAGLLRLQVVWPFPEQVIEELAGQVSTIIMPEINMGQIVREVRQSAQGRCQVVSLTHTGGAIHTPEVILQAIEQAAAVRA